MQRDQKARGHRELDRGARGRPSLIVARLPRPRRGAARRAPQRRCASSTPRSTSSRTRSPASPRASAGRDGAASTLLDGPTGVAFCRDGPGAVAKALNDFARARPAMLALRGGLLDGVASRRGRRPQRLATLPSRDQLHRQLLGGLAAPISGVRQRARRRCRAGSSSRSTRSGSRRSRGLAPRLRTSDQIRGVTTHGYDQGQMIEEHQGHVRARARRPRQGARGEVRRLRRGRAGRGRRAGGGGGGGERRRGGADRVRRRPHGGRRPRSR